MGFKKNQIFAQNLLVLAYCLSKNHEFVAKSDRNSVFLSRDLRFPDQLYIMATYMSFYGFSNFSNFCSKSVGVSIRF
jgi:hypothetical protein